MVLGSLFLLSLEAIALYGRHASQVFVFVNTRAGPKESVGVYALTPNNIFS